MNLIKLSSLPVVRVRSSQTDSRTDSETARQTDSRTDSETARQTDRRKAAYRVWTVDRCYKWTERQEKEGTESVDASVSK